MMEISSCLQDDRLTVFLSGKLDYHCVKDVITAVICKIEESTPLVCIMNFQDVRFIDESGAAVVLNILREMTKLKGCLSLCGVRNQPMGVFRASGIDKLVRIEPSEK